MILYLIYLETHIWANESLCKMTVSPAAKCDVLSTPPSTPPQDAREAEKWSSGTQSNMGVCVCAKHDEGIKNYCCQIMNIEHVLDPRLVF